MCGEVDDARRLLMAGAEKVSVNTAAVERPALVTELAAEFGAQCVVVAVETRRVAGDATTFVVTTHGGRTSTTLDAVAWAQEVEGRGRARSCSHRWIATAPTRASTSSSRAVSDTVGVPVIASGGVGTPADLAEGVIEGGADGVLAASESHFGEHTIADAKDELTHAGLIVRPA